MRDLGTKEINLLALPGAILPPLSAMMEGMGTSEHQGGPDQRFETPARSQLNSAFSEQRRLESNRKWMTSAEKLQWEGIRGDRLSSKGNMRNKHGESDDIRGKELSNVDTMVARQPRVEIELSTIR